MPLSSRVDDRSVRGIIADGVTEVSKEPLAIVSNLMSGIWSTDFSRVFMRGKGPIEVGTLNAVKLGATPLRLNQARS